MKIVYTTQPSRPLIVDANNLIVRHIMTNALDDLKAGETWTGGVYGTLKSLVSLMNMEELGLINGVYMFYDGGIPKRRKEYIPEFKANREEKRGLLTDEQKEKAFTQLELCWEMFDLLGFTVAKYAEREADDTCAAAVQLFKSREIEPILLSGDHDLYQTIMMGAQVWDPRLHRLIDRDVAREIYGFDLQAFLLYRALSGDSSDGVKGPRGVGKKRAVEMILEMVHDYDTGSNGGYSFYDDSPASQLDALVDFLMKKPKRRVYEDNVIAQRDRLQNVMIGSDLTDSFGPMGTLTKRIDAIPPPPDKLRFLGFCKRLGFQSVTGNPDPHFEPFRQAYYRRLQAHHAGTATA